MIGVRKWAPAALMLLALTACAASSQASTQAAQGGAIAEVLLGFWHGIIAPITLIAEIISEVSPGTLPWALRFYEVSNDSVLYDVGFYVGLVAGPSMLWTGASRRRPIV